MRFPLRYAVTRYIRTDSCFGFTFYFNFQKNIITFIIPILSLNSYNFFQFRQIKKTIGWNWIYKLYNTLCKKIYKKEKSQQKNFRWLFIRKKSYILTIEISARQLQPILYTNFSPSRDPIKATATSAVLFLSSRIGLTSTNSAEVIKPDSWSISIAK